MRSKEAILRAKRNYRIRHAKEISVRRKETRNVANPVFKKKEDAYRKKNKERIARRTLQWKARKFGISIERIKEMMQEQENLCFLCRRPPGKRSLAIDHDHKTGEIRKLLCHHCNTGLGHFQEDAILLRKAAEYVLGSWRDTKAIKL